MGACAPITMFLPCRARVPTLLGPTENHAMCRETGFSGRTSQPESVHAPRGLNRLAVSAFQAEEFDLELTN